MIWFATLLAYVLFLSLIFTLPLHNILLRKRIAQTPKGSPEWRTTMYLGNMLITWLQVLLLIVICLGLGWAPGVSGLQLPTNIPLAVLCILVLALCILAYELAFRNALRQLLRNPAQRSSLPPMVSLLPRTTKDRLEFAASLLTAGFGEEILYRGFICAYLTQIFPQCNLIWAILVAALIFGLNHVNQGPSTVALNIMMGLVYGLLYVITGSIFPCMIVHALFNLRLFLIDARLFDKPKRLSRNASSLPS